MKLDKFIEESLKQIISGVVEAQKFGNENGANINPVDVAWNSSNESIMYQPDSGVPIQQINFDIAVTVTEGSKTQDAPTISVGNISLSDTAKQKELKNSSLSRIQFSVPILLPTTGTKPNRENFYSNFYE